jgi:hypothetical protein
MKVHHEITQLSEAWFRIKYGKVGGSTSKGLFVPSDTLLLELLAEVTEPFQMSEDEYISKDMQRGIELEPMHKAEIQKYTGVKFLTPGWLQSEECPLIGISPDGISEDLTVSWEGKAPGAKKHIETVYSKEIPKDNIHQCLQYFTVNPKLEKHYFSTFRPENDYPMWAKCLTREALIDLGTKAKPVVKPISEWVKIALFNALELEANLGVALKELEKI